MATNWNDIKYKFSGETRERIQQEAKAELDRIGFGKLRQARKQTQVALAERLDIPQASVSRLERRADMYIGTLRSYVEGLGGKLELHAVFPDGDFVLESLGPARRKSKGSSTVDQA